MTFPGIDVETAHGDVGAIRSFASQLRVRSAAHTDRAGAARAAVAALAGTEGKSPDALRPRIAMLADRFDRTAAASGDVAVILDDYAGALESLCLRIASAVSHAHFAYDQIWIRRGVALSAVSEFVTGWALDWDDVLPTWLYLDDRSHLVRWADAIEEFRSARTAVLALEGERHELDQRTASRLRSVALFTELAPSATATPAARLTAASLWVGDLAGVTVGGLAALENPELIRQVWNALPAQQREALIAASPLLIGNLDGIPIRDRVTANRINIADEIARREGVIHGLEAARARDLARKDSYPVHHDDSAINEAYDAKVAAEQRIIAACRQLLTAPVRWHDQSGVQRTSIGARVVVFDPAIEAIAAYHGAIDEVTGDIPAWVVHVAISVPGTGATMTDFADDRAAAFHSDAGPRSAVFQWAGGSFPGDVGEATQSSFADMLAPSLRDFAAGVAVPEGGSLTMLGHSYGAAVIGLAEQAGLVADRVLYVSSVGLGHGVEGIGDFPRTADAPHYSMMVRNDLIVGLVQGGGAGDMHGPSALTADGVVRLETGRLDQGDPDSPHLEDYDEPDNGMPRELDAHGTLFTRGATSYNNMIAVITGGRAELYAPDEVILAGDRVIVVDGLDRAGYTPTYSRIE